VINANTSTTECRQLIHKLYQASPLFVFESEVAVTNQKEEGGSGGGVDKAAAAVVGGGLVVISSLPHSDMVESIEACWEDVVKEYLKEARGPKVIVCRGGA
jgi:hypothetical protein